MSFGRVAAVVVGIVAFGAVAAASETKSVDEVFACLDQCSLEAQECLDDISTWDMLAWMVKGGIRPGEECLLEQQRCNSACT